MNYLHLMLFIPLSVLFCGPASAQLDQQYQQQQQLNRDAEAAKQNLCRQIRDNAQFKAGDSLWLIDTENKLFTMGPDPKNLLSSITGAMDCYFSAVLGEERWVNNLFKQSCNPNKEISLGNYGGMHGMAAAAAQACYLQKYVIEDDSLVLYSMLSKMHGGDGSVQRSVVATRFR